MISKVITLTGVQESVKVAERCIKSARHHGVEVVVFNAVTPKLSKELASENKVVVHSFREKYSRYRNALAAFMSHFCLWKECVESKQPFLILEHDAVFLNDIPQVFMGDIINLGAPSYGKFNIPSTIGEGPLESKTYFPGAHAYYITPKGARELIGKAKKDARPTDIFINKESFPDLKEVYPWPIEARDTFTTIQREDGIQAKHSFMKTGKMEILDVQ